MRQRLAPWCREFEANSRLDPDEQSEDRSRIRNSNSAGRRDALLIGTGDAAAVFRKLACPAGRLALQKVNFETKLLAP